MGFFFGEKKTKEVLPEHKFDYINLADFHSDSFLDKTAYVSLYFGVFISLCCYAADTYTCITLLAFNRWSSQIEPIISLTAAKIVFSVCILISFLLLSIDWFFAIRVIRGNGIANAYMNPLALRWNSIRGGKEREDTGWRRFLVFARLTKERSKKDYIALLTYFAFKGWLRILVAEGPRVVINTLTLISVVQADLLPTEETEALSTLSKLFENIGHLAETNTVEAIILSTMAFTTLLWIFAILRLLLAGLLYICYLYHVITTGESLRNYCKERIDSRMGDIVKKNHVEGLKEEKKNRPDLLNRQPTLPVILGEEKSLFPGTSVAPPMPAVTRTQTLRSFDDNRSIAPSMVSRAPTAVSAKGMPRPAVKRVGTTGSEGQMLIGNQAEMGYGGRGRISEDSQFSAREPAFRGGRMRTPGPPPSQRGTPGPQQQSAPEYKGDTYGHPRSTRTPGPPPSQRGTPAPESQEDGYGPGRNMRTPGPPPSHHGTPAPELQGGGYPPRGMRQGPPPSHRGTPGPEYQDSYGPPRNMRTPGPPPSMRGTPAQEYQRDAYDPPRNMRTPGPPQSRGVLPISEYQHEYPPHEVRPAPPPSQRGTPGPEYQEAYGLSRNMGTPGPSLSLRSTPAPRSNDPYSQPAPPVNSEYSDPYAQHSLRANPEYESYASGPPLPRSSPQSFSPHQSPVGEPVDPEYPLQDLYPQQLPSGRTTFVVDRLARQNEQKFDFFGELPHSSPTAITHDNSDQNSYGALTSSPTTYTSPAAYENSGSPPRRNSPGQRFPIKLPEPTAVSMPQPAMAQYIPATSRGSPLPKLQTSVYTRPTYSPATAVEKSAKSERFPIAVRQTSERRTEASERFPIAAPERSVAGVPEGFAPRSIQRSFTTGENGPKEFVPKPIRRSFTAPVESSEDPMVRRGPAGSESNGGMI